MLTRRRVPFGTADDNFLNGFNPSSNDADPHLDSRVRPASAKDCSRISVQDRTVEFLSVIKYAQARNVIIIELLHITCNNYLVSFGMESL